MDKPQYYCKRIATVCYQLEEDTAIQLSETRIEYAEKGDWIAREGNLVYIIPDSHFSKAYRLIGENLRDVHVAGWRLIGEIED